jgi:hypothetical protein
MPRHPTRRRAVGHTQIALSQTIQLPANDANERESKTVTIPMFSLSLNGVGHRCEKLGGNSAEIRVHLRYSREVFCIDTA